MSPKRPCLRLVTRTGTDGELTKQKEQIARA